MSATIGLSSLPLELLNDIASRLPGRSINSLQLSTRRLFVVGTYLSNSSRYLSTRLGGCYISFQFYRPGCKTLGLKGRFTYLDELSRRRLANDATSLQATYIQDDRYCVFQFRPNSSELDVYRTFSDCYELSVVWNQEQNQPEIQQEVDLESWQIFTQFCFRAVIIRLGSGLGSRQNVDDGGFVRVSRSWLDELSDTRVKHILWLGDDHKIGLEVGVERKPVQASASDTAPTWILRYSRLVVDKRWLLHLDDTN